MNLEIEIIGNLRETNGFQPPEGWAGLWDSDHSMGGAYAAGRMARAILDIRERHSEGRVAVCTHGDTLPVFIAFLIGGHAIEVTPLPPLRGSWYTIRLTEDGSANAQLNTLEPFPS